MSRVKRQYIIPTVNHFIKQYLQPLFQVSIIKDNAFSSDKVFLFGSTGKKTDSGDIDIALDLTKFDKSSQTKEGLMKLIYIFAKKKSFDRQIVINTISNDMIHFAYPQYNEHGTPTGQTVQVDLLFCQYPDFCKFYAYYPGEDKTKYKSAHRNELLKAIATVVTKKNIFVDKKTYQVLRWQQEDINNDGVFAQVQTLIDDDGNRLKYKDTNEDLISSYAKVVQQILVTHDPKVCVTRYVGHYTSKDIQSFQQLFNIISSDKNFKFANIKDDILYEAARRLKENTRLQFPSELEGYFQ